eukprot:CAMPEP_0170597886 /NCGR_PEP_ID=MMETSP0224-20130122/15946_1 /TAXON_ID=285029 /ORGANISM="Togula jolla, Strain CCCM 725" /LENGTH=88 /DNA_ID=CAMNT_0010922387 /DNA_START=65 /DNA_END=332 /DNA_ORIENTATION=+
MLCAVRSAEVSRLKVEQMHGDATIPPASGDSRNSPAGKNDAKGGSGRKQKITFADQTTPGGQLEEIHEVKEVKNVGNTASGGSCCVTM